MRDRIRARARGLVCLFSALALACAAAVGAHGQQPDVRVFETEEDLWEALREGEVSYEEYLELLETHQLGADTSFVPGTDWEGLPGSDAGYLLPPDSSHTVVFPARERAQQSTRRRAGQGALRWSWRSGVNGTLSSPTGQMGYSSGRVTGDRWKALVHYRDDARGGRWQRRAVEYDAGPITIQAGNIEPRWGRGLVVGRRSRLAGAPSADPTAGDFWQPALSRFNGFRATANPSRVFVADAFVTDIRTGLLRERAAAMMVGGAHGGLRFGVAGLRGEVQRRGILARRMFEVVGAHAQVGAGERALLAEVAASDDGGSAIGTEAVWRFAYGRFHGRAWSYSEDFINLWGGGPGHSDRTSIELPEVETTWSSRTTGERGFSLTTHLVPEARVRGGRMRARWDWMTHREYPGEPLRHDWTTRLEWRRSGVSVRPFARGTTIEGSPGRHGIGSFADIGGVDRRVSLQWEFGRHRVSADRYIRVGTGGRLRVSNAVRIQPFVRWVDPNLDRAGDGYWYIYFTEVIFPASWWQMEAAVVWQRFEDRGRGDVIEIRVRVFTQGQV